MFLANDFRGNVFLRGVRIPGFAFIWQLLFVMFLNMICNNILKVGRMS